MNYYKPSTFIQKIQKLLRLYWVFVIGPFRRMKPVTLAKPSKHPVILMVVPHLDFVGGLENQALELSSALTRLGNWVTIVSDRFSKSPSREFQNGFLIYRVPSNLPQSKLSLLISLLLFLVHRRRSYGIVHAHGVTGMTLFALRVAKSLGMKTVIKGTTKDDFANIFSEQNRKHRQYQRWIKSIDCFIGISDELRNEMIACNIPAAKIKSIPNFVNTTKFFQPSADRREMIRSSFSVSKDQLIFLYLGRLEERKGVDFLLHAWQQISSGSLWIVGSGPAEERWRKLSEELRLQNIHFWGKTLIPIEFYHAADMFIFPSIREGFPNVLLEAMSCGLPCIATKIGGVTDIMQNDHQGLMVPPAASHELAQAITYSAAHPDARKKWSENAVRTIHPRFELSHTVSEYVSLYSELLS
jgi:glycosyltransferase involved in cell wall biosynthesis